MEYTSQKNWLDNLGGLLQMTNTNENRPGYKNTKIGWLPEDWDVIKIKKIGRINADSLKENTPPDFQFYYLDLSSIKNGIIDFPNEKISFKDAPSRARRKLKTNDVIMATVRPNLQGFAYCDFNSEIYICSTGFALITVKKEYVAKFLYQQLFGYNITRQLFNLVVGSNYPAVNSKDVGNLKIPLPPLPEQKKIAEILSTWDTAISKYDTLISKYELRKKALMQKLLTGKVRFKEFEGQKWKEVRLKDIFDRIQKKVDKRVEHVLSITSTIGFVDQKEKFSKVIAGEAYKNYILLKKGEFAYNKGNSKTYPQGCVFRLEEFELGAVPNVYLSFRVKNKEVSSDFYKYVFMDGTLNHQLHKVINSGVRNDGLLNLNPGDFFKCKVLYPQIDEQRKIASVLTAQDKQIDLLKKQKAVLEEQKKGLMQKLLTGEKRVKVS